MTTAGEQLDWLVAASARAPLPVGEIQERMAQSLVDGSGGPDGLNAALSGLGPLEVRAIRTDSRDEVQAVVSAQAGDYFLTVRIDGAGRVADLRLTPDEVATSWP